MTIFQKILDSLFPKKKEVVELEERGKQGSLRFLPGALETPAPWMRAIFQYKNSKVRQLIWEIKYAGNPILIRDVGALLSEEIVSFFEERGSFVSKDWMLVAVPPTKEHEKEKGFNQTDELCKEVIKSLGKNVLSYSPNTLKKTTETEPQAKIKNRSKRLQNLKNSYIVSNPSNVTGKNIIIIDDVLTTGSTLIEARRALREAGAKKVLGLAVAH